MSIPIVGPVPPYTNPPIEPQYYQPSKFYIEDVTLGRTTTVTTTEDHNYVIGQLVRLLIPSSFGCVQLNNTQGYVISIPASNEVELDIDSSNDTLDIRFGKHRLALRNFVADISSSTDDRELIVSGVAQWNIIFVC